MPDQQLERRDFVKAAGSGVIVLLTADVLDAQAPKEIAAWLHIGEDSAITVYTGKVEVGQNIRTSLTQAVAEELRVNPAIVRMVMGDTDLTPFDMGTFGSRTTPTMAPQLRRVAVTARELLMDMAAERWQVNPASVEVADGRVRHGTHSLTFGELTQGKKLMKPVTAAAAGVPRGDSVKKIDGREFVTGAHQYPSDIKRPGMLYGRVLRPPSYHAKLTSVNLEKARHMDGVHVVRDGDFIGVAAPDSHKAARALEAIDAEWKTERQPSSKDIFEYLKTHGVEGEGRRSGGERGSVEEGMQSARHKVEAEYTIAYIAHVPLEPRAAVAEWNDGRLTVWTGTQRPFGVKGELAEAFQIPESKVHVMMPDMGSGYGGKHTGECAIEAARLAKVVGRPVKLTYTREEEFSWAYFRPAGVIQVKGGVKDGLLTAWEFHNYNSGPSAIETKYEVGNQKIAFHPSRTPLRQGAYRGLAATANHFARECHMDDLARAAGLDPLDFRRRNIKDTRLRAVLEAAAERFGWGKPKSHPKQGYGVACGFEKGGYVGCCAEVTVDGPRIKVDRIVTAFECGAIVNPGNLKNQVEGAVMMGIGGALFEAVEFADGRILNGQLSQYRVPRFGDLPALETILLDRKDIAGAGAGETPIVGVAPAIGNAVRDAVGVRLRSLPMRLDRA